MNAHERPEGRPDVVAGTDHDSTVALPAGGAQHRSDLARLAVHAALWGDPEPVLDALDDGRLDPDMFGDIAPIVVAIREVIVAGEPAWPENVHASLVASGWTHADAAEAVLQPGVFEMAGCRTGGFDHWLHLLAEDHERIRLHERLLSLANSLDRPGGPGRVAAALGEVA